MTQAKILIVEDERVVARDIQKRLHRVGYTVAGITALGEEAVRLAEDLRPDLVLMDIRLQGTVDGVDAAQQIRSRCQLPVVYLTAYADEDTLQRARITEPFGYVLKPFDERDLRTVIEMALYKHHAERKLRESEHRYAVTLSSIGDGVIATDSRGCVTFINPVAESLTGWHQEEAVGQPLNEVFHIISEETRASVENPVARVLQTGTVVGLANHTVLVAKDGREIPIDDCGAPIHEDEKTMAGVVLVFHDVTERRQAEEALRASEERFRSAFEHTKVATVLTDTNLRLVRPNAAFVEMFGYSEHELLEMSRDDLTHPDDLPATRAHMESLMAGKIPSFQMEKRYLRKDGQILWGLVSVSLVHDTQGRPLQCIAQVHDITERKHAEEQLKASLREKEALVKEVHHRVKNNLQIITSLLKLQAAQIRDPAVADLFTQSQNRVRSMALVHESLYQSGTLSSINLAPHIEGLCSHLFKSYGVDPNRIVLRTSIANVALDMDRAIPCSMIVTELVSNALKHAFPEGRSGHLTVELHVEPEQQHTLAVKDDGVGLPEDLDISRTESLGLQLVSSLTQQLGGTVTLERAGGTTFTITFKAV